MMSNNLDISTHDFEDICRTCLSKGNLKSLYQKRNPSICFAEMLMCCTSMKFTEDDGLPGKVCTNCIQEINQAFLFVKHCESIDKILRTCVINNSFQPETVKPIIKPGISLPKDFYQTVAVLGKVDDINQEIIVKKECEASKKGIKQEELIIKNEFDETYVDSVNESFDGVDDETYSDNKHIKIHTGEKIHNCKVCNKAFKQLHHLKGHMRIHTDEKSHFCEVCKKPFNRPDNLRRHMKIHTGDKPHTCGVCNRRFKQLQHLKLHIRIHTGEKPHTCEVCSKAFIQPHHLKSHMKSHSSKVFIQEHHLKANMKRYLEENPHSCAVCSKTFTHLYSLQRHLRVHTGEKPHVCRICSKTFTESSNLKVHMRLHTGEKPHVCEICSKTFTQAQHLKLHMRLHSGEKPYTCEICEKAFIQPGLLKYHLRNTHQKEKHS